MLIQHPVFFAQSSTRGNVKFTTHQYADISTAYVNETDMELMSNPAAPHHMAEHDDGVASFFFVPNPETAERFKQSAVAFGFSERFIAIMLELSRQGIPIASECTSRRRHSR